MAARSAKRYYFVQISEEKFFNNVRIKALEKDGAELVLSFQRLILEALKENDPGFVRLDPAFDSMSEQIATMLNCDLDHAEKLYDTLIKRHLCKVTDYGLWIPLSKELTASRTEKADEVKKRRAAVKEEEAKKAESVKVSSEEDDDDEDDDDQDANVGGTKEIISSPYKRNQENKKAIAQITESKKTEVKRTENQITEKKREESKSQESHSQESKIQENQKTEPREKERREEITKNISNPKESNNHKDNSSLLHSCADSKQSERRNKEADSDEEPADTHTFCSKVYGYLKEKIGFEFFHTASNDALIEERRSEGFTLKDFFKIIDLKCSQWLHNSKMRPYLRVSTLFGPKMDNYRYEVYCNQKPSYDGRCNIGGGYYLKNPIMAKPENVDLTADPFANASDFVKQARKRAQLAAA